MKKISRNDLCPCGSGKKYKHCCGLQGVQAERTATANASIHQAMQVAVEHHQAGRLPQAEAIYRQILQAAPNHPDALHLLGLIAQRAGKNEIAVELISKAISVNPSSSTYHNNLGNALKDQGKLDAATDSYRTALVLKPDLAETHYNLGNVLQEQGKLDAAVECYRKVLSLKPDYAEAHYNLGFVLQDQGRLDEAIDSYRKALSLKTNYAEAHNTLGTALQDQGKLDEAIDSYRKALSLKTNYAEALSNLGSALQDQGKLDEAINTLQKALLLKPDYAKAYYNLGNALRDQGKFEAEVESYQKALALKPDYAEAHNNMGLALHRQGKLEAAIESYRRALALKPDYAKAHSNLLFALQYDTELSVSALLDEHRRYAARFEELLKAGWLPHRNTRDTGRRLKIGYVSPDFRRHAVAYFIEPVLANHDKERFEVYCYYNHAQRDEFTQRIEGYSDQWRECREVTDETLAELIRADGIDILVDLAGHTAKNRMLAFARKPAPVQITYLGYPGTSGLSAMDYRLTDWYADPEGSEANYTERLLRLPDSLCCYRPGAGMPEIVPLAAEKNGYITFGSFNSFNKIDRLSIELWAQLLRAIPDARLLMVTVPEGGARQRLTEQFAALGVGAERLEFYGRLAGDEFYRMMQRVDIALDPIAVTGGTTTCETLWMGVPVIVLAGTRYITRVGYSFLSAAGLQDFAVTTAQGYLHVALRLAQNIPLLAELHAGLRAHVSASALADEARFTRNLEAAYRQVWIEWCSKVT